MASGVGLIPEQAWELADLPRSPFGTDPTKASIGFANGEPAGSAAALTWSAAGFVRLMLIIGSGDPLDRPDYTYDRYVKRTRDHGPDRDGARRPLAGHRLDHGRRTSPPATR